MVNSPCVKYVDVFETHLLLCFSATEICLSADTTKMDIAFLIRILWTIFCNNNNYDSRGCFLVSLYSAQL
jgi:hypothetical protein